MTPETYVKLVAIGYEYNSQNAMCFIMTKDAGSTTPPDHHSFTAQFPNKFGNITEEKVYHPGMISS